MGIGFIDSPPPYAPEAEWRAFLEQLRGLTHFDGVDQAIKDAEDHVAWIVADELKRAQGIPGLRLKAWV